MVNRKQTDKLDCDTKHKKAVSILTTTATRTRQQHWLTVYLKGIEKQGINEMNVRFGEVVVGMGIHTFKPCNYYSIIFAKN